jgi:hypothetical protein
MMGAWAVGHGWVGVNMTYRMLRGQVARVSS